MRTPGTERGSFHTLVAAIELLPETPMGRRGSRQRMVDLRRAFENRLPVVERLVTRAGGQLVLAWHTRLLALLPPDTPDAAEIAREITSVNEAQPSPAIAIARGRVDWLKTRSHEQIETLYHGPAVSSVKAALDELDSGGIAEESAEAIPTTASPFTPGMLASSPESPAIEGFAAVCAVAFALNGKTPDRAASIAELANGMDGSVICLMETDGTAVAMTAFSLAAGNAASEQRACDFALLLRDQYGAGVRVATVAGEVLSPNGVSSAIPGLMGEPVIKTIDLLDHAEAGQVVTDGATAQRLAGAYAVQPVGGVTHGGKRSPAGTTVVLWREHPVATTELFVGRETELEQIQLHLSTTTANALHVTGPPGIGKSTLVRQIVRSRPASALLVVAGSDRPEAPFASLADALKEYWDLPEQGAPSYTSYLSERLASARSRVWDEELLDDWARAEQFMQHALGVDHPVVSALDPQTRYQGLLDGLATLLRSLQPIRVLWIDDLQWIDEGSAAAIASWLTERDPSRLRVVATVRTRMDSSNDSGKERSLGLNVEKIELSGLAETSARALLTQRGTTQLLEEDDLGMVLDHCAGNPFFLEQCARFVEEEVRAGSTPQIPESVQKVIQARIERLAADVREAVEMAAVLGLRFNMRILSAMLREEKLPNALQSAQREGFWEAANELNFIFCHALIRDAIYDAQFDSRRTELHAAAVQAFEQVYTGEARRAHLYEIAEHCEHSGQGAAAERYLSEAAEYALEQFENERAVGLLRRRLSLSKGQSLAAVHGLGAALVRTGAWEEAVLLFEQVASRDVHSVQPEEARSYALCCSTFAELLIERGDTPRAQQVAKTGIESVALPADDESLALLHRSLGLAHFQRTEYESALAEYGTALEFAQASGDERTVGRLMNNIAVVHSKTGKHREALQAFESNLELARRLNDFMGKSTALNNIGYLYNEIAEFEKAMPYFREDLSLCTEAGHRQGQAIALGNIASILASLGRHEEAIVRFTETIEADSRIGFLPHKAYNLQQLGTSLIAVGKRDEGCERLQEAADLAREIEFPMVQEKTTELLGGCVDPE